MVVVYRSGQRVGHVQEHVKSFRKVTAPVLHLGRVTPAEIELELAEFFLPMARTAEC